MLHSIMKRIIMAATIIQLCFMAPAYAQDNCGNCHFSQGIKPHVDRVAFEQSVHGFLACTKCHLGISEYPHRRVAKVSCGICHFLGTSGAPMKQAQEFKQSVHNRVAAVGTSRVPVCQTCHGTHAILSAADPRSSTNRKNIPALCSQCHPAEYAAYKKSIHAVALEMGLNKKAPTCFDCHLEHLVPPTGTHAWKLALVKQCGTCHQEQLDTYRKTYHGKVSGLGYSSVAKCADCHGSHEIMSVNDDASPLAPGNILATCRKCHANATTGFTKFYAHADERDRAKYPVMFYTFVFMTVLLIGTFAFFLTHTLLWAYRSLKERMNARKEQ
jgi:hypothetical protein